MKRDLTEKQFAWLLILPAVILVFGLDLYPLIETLIYSLRDMNLTANHYGSFVGLKNYITVLSDTVFWQSLGRTAYFAIVSIVLELGLGMAIALLINDKKIKGRRFLQSIIILPWAIPTIVNGAMWNWIYNPDFGALNALLKQLHIIDQYQSWLGTPWTAMNMILLADVWKMTPIVVIFFLAALQLTNASVYEAAQIDGAGLLRRFWYITLPNLKSILLVVVVMRTMEAFKVFDIIYATTRGGPADGTMVLTFQAYLKAFNNLEYSTGATYSYLIALLIALLTFSYVRLLKRKEAK
ncbi:carbohydrate ABC transporter permease [Sporolactobacillus terrae]|uniref:carbohydrate ABC transporter permease n=1 Tax=Sporolactobacillus terrae TaxID=269673 RepID=UPI00048D4527|nr:sugar ABC transporter permease [Sporolactobacillus terrae]